MTKQYSYCVYNVVRPNSRPYNTNTFHSDKTIQLLCIQRRPSL